ncbi:cytochrome d ubiquinol oxidase subunit II [Helicobacter sp. 11S02596-1]|uniref:cytochrome d ubiquinol oxidase subunit II n=1 Tax=Helicobacter sp. 11S02596-1 TaxID=1476194 RepID=UPI000BA7582B|nr:cytochrome d ubiquinol oxidase subunit II [Helicobacter sp. 11S02596-1]PAF44484.1 cytochrome d ubiquinol oxidase subunit II [Helicobacter sp. 11S02596-1]
MFEVWSLHQLQVYWWCIISLLGGLLVMMFFVQGGQSLLGTLAKTELEKTLIINSLGRKWELTFTTLVLFGGAAFAAFPLFYATSFGGAYWVWLCILFCFILQAVAYEFRSKPANVWGKKTYEIFLYINGYLGVFLIGVAVSTFFSGSSFELGEHNFVYWQSPFRGLEQLQNPANYLLGFALVFLSRILGASYLFNHIDQIIIRQRAKRAILINTLLFLPFFLGFVAWICLKDGFHIVKNGENIGEIVMVSHQYFLAFIEQPYLLAIFLIGVIGVLLGIYLNVFKDYTRSIFILGAGSVLAVMAVFLNVGLGGSAFYPSTYALSSSLTIMNASSSHYTLVAMSYVSLFIPFVLAYIVYVWYCMDRVKISEEEIKKSEHLY